MPKRSRRSTAAAAARLAIVALATLRLTRLSTSDWLGEWVFVRPAKAWAYKAESAELEWRSVEIAGLPEGAAMPAWALDDNGNVRGTDDPFSWQAKLVKGLDCPFCVGFWLGGVVLLGEVTIARVPVLGAIWRFGLSMLALNYVVGHISKRIDG